MLDVRSSMFEVRCSFGLPSGDPAARMMPMSRPFPRATTLALALCLASTLNAAEPPGDLDVARQLYSQRKTAEAKAAFEKLAVAQPGNAEVHSYLARLALVENQPEAAVRHAETAAGLEPKSAKYQSILGDAYGYSAQRASLLSKAGFAKKCLAAYQRASALEPDNADYHANLFEFYRQAPAFIGGGASKALAEANEIKRLDPQRGRMLLAIWRTDEKQYTAALQELDESLKENPEDYGALYQVGRLAAVSGEHLDRGLESLQRCLTLTPPPNHPGPAPVKWRIGNILERKKDRDGARAAYEAAVKADPAFKPAVESLKALR